ncbi:response regulator transcription factor [Altericista sp. CCNU0014]|uniref:response regulator transcription factor n=1 Tax=Altericista sp. CCNU0014 TaxID=3082949 RepID=UPI00384F9E8A
MVTKILVIEDELNVRENLVELLEAENYEVFSAQDGFEGISFAQEHRPELVLCDVTMPDLDGYDVLSNLRQDPEIALTPFIFLTAKAASEEIRQGMNLGADDYLTKPFSRKELLSTIEARLSKQKIYTQNTDALLSNIGESFSYSISEKIFNPLDEILGASKIFVQDSNFIESDDIKKLGDHIQVNAKFLKRAILNVFMYLNMELLFRNPEALKIIQNIYTMRPGDFVFMIAMQMAKKYECSKTMTVNVNNARLKIATNDWKKIVEESLDFIFSLPQKNSSVNVETNVIKDSFQYSICFKADELPFDLLQKVSLNNPRNQAFYEELDAGLGLLITHFIVKLYGGEFTIKSDKNAWGESLTLLISFPLTTTEQ